MAFLCNSLIFSFFFISTWARTHPTNFDSGVSLSFPLTIIKRSPYSSSPRILSSIPSTTPHQTTPPSAATFKFPFKYSMALIVPLPVGTPPQIQQMVLDTGSQLSWIQCNKNSPATVSDPSFNPSLSSTFSPLACSNPICKPSIPDFTVPTTCDQNRLCHYSYFYADGTLAEGNLMREKISMSIAQSTPPLALGCASVSPEAEGILGMNRGRLSFTSQIKLSKFSYCVPLRQPHGLGHPTGSFYIGENPNSHSFQYVDILNFPQYSRLPNFDPLAYTIGMHGIRIGGKRLNISASVFRPDISGSGQTMIDSGTEYTFLVDEAYDKVREEVVRKVGGRMKEGFVYGGAMDMCFDGDGVAIGRLIGEVVLELEKGVEVRVPGERLLADVGEGVQCLSFGRSSMLGVASNIIGSFHQQDLWVEFDVSNGRVGLGKAECSSSSR